MQKRGRPPSKYPTEQVAVRLPKEMIEQFRRKGRGGVSAEIQERLWKSFSEVEPNLQKLAGQIEELAKSVHRHFGAEWHADAPAHHAFLDTVRRLLADIPEPTATITTVKASAEVVGEVIYRDFVATTRELEQKGRTGFKPTTRQQVENDK
jgi:hypothetical protein